MPARVACATVALVLGLTGCGSDESSDSGPVGAPGLSPSMGPETTKPGAKRKERRQDKRRKRHRQTPSPSPAQAPGSVAPGRSSGDAGGGGGGGATAPTATVRDARGDVAGSAPGYVDLTGATLRRDGNRFRLAVTSAAGLPSRSTGDTTMNVVTFFDLDGDGQVDYEVWATLSDNGWSSSYRTPRGGKFGSRSGVDVSASANVLTLGFPVSHLEGDRAFRWTVGSEHGSFGQVAAGATAKDYAPDQGAVRFPG